MLNKLLRNELTRMKVMKVLMSMSFINKLMKGQEEIDNFFDEDYTNLVGDSEFDRYERPSSPTDPLTCIVSFTHIDQTTLHDQSNLNPYE